MKLSYYIACAMMSITTFAYAIENNAPIVDNTNSYSTSDILSDEEILRKADLSRGGGLPGMIWRISVDSILKRGREESFELEVMISNGDWLAQFKAPNNVRGNKLLQRQSNMWFSKKGLRKPVPISLRQRLTGSAANGDIASTNYAENYDAIRLEDDTFNGSPVYVFDLKAKSTKVTYDRVKYMVDKETGVGVKAFFYTAAGKLLKSAVFYYNNEIVLDEQPYPFVSQMVIENELNQGQRSTLNYSDIQLESVSKSKLRL